MFSGLAADSHAEGDMVSLGSLIRTELPPPDSFWRLKIGELWRFFRRQPPSFWMVSFYLFIEYVRPQQVWPVIDVLPWGRVAILGCLAALFLEGKFPSFRSRLSWLYLVFVGIVVASSFAAVNPAESWRMLYLPISWFLVFLLITNIVNTERRFLIFLGFFLLWSFKMSQHGFRSWMQSGFGFRDWGATGGPGWFHNSGEFGIQMCVFFPLTIAFFLALYRYWDRIRTWFFLILPVTAIASMIASSSRGALVGLAAVLVWMIGRSRFRVRAAVYGAVLAAAIVVLMPEEQKERFSNVGKDGTSIQRLVVWKRGIRITQEHPILGIGYNNWLRYNNARWGGELLPHNIFIEAGSELGYVGLFSFLSLILGTFWVNRGTRRIGRSLGERGLFLYHMGHGLDGALIGYLASGFFVTVLHYPYFWINLSMVVSLRIAAERSLREVAVSPTKVQSYQRPRVGRVVPVPTLSRTRGPLPHPRG